MMVSSPAPENSILQKMNSYLKRFEENGYLLLSQCLTTETTSAVKQIVSNVYQQWLANNAVAYANQGLLNMHSLTAPHYFALHQEQRAVLFDRMATPDLVQITQAAFGDELYFHGTQLFFNPVNREQPTYWHRDIQYMGLSEDDQQRYLSELCNLHVRIPLIPETGFELVPGSHRRWDTEQERQTRLELAGRAKSDALTNGKCFDLQPGDVLIFSAHILHRGHYLNNPERLSLDILLGKPHALVSSSLDERQLPTDEELELVEHPLWYQNARKLIGSGA